MLPATQTYSKSFQAIMSVILQLYMYLLLLGTAVLSLTSISFGCVLCLFPNFYHSSLSFTYRFNSTVLDISVVFFPVPHQMNRSSFGGEESHLHRKNHSCLSQRQERNQEFGSEIPTCIIFSSLIAVTIGITLFRKSIFPGWHLPSQRERSVVQKSEIMISYLRILNVGYAMIMIVFKASSLDHRYSAPCLPLKLKFYGKALKEIPSKTIWVSVE